MRRLGHTTRHFNVGQYRRKQKGDDLQDAAFFDHNNTVCAPAWVKISIINNLYYKKVNPAVVHLRVCVIFFMALANLTVWQMHGSTDSLSAAFATSSLCLLLPFCVIETQHC